METEEMVKNEEYEQIMLANAIEEFLAKLLEDYTEEYFVEISVGNDDSDKMVTTLTKTFRGSKQLME
jgi:hypothetical protein